MKPFTTVASCLVPLLRENVDTDQIIPARFLKVTTREGLGAHLFEDLRRGADGAALGEFPLNRPEYAGAAILLAGANFGCGSSREHAAWALVDYGFRVVMSTSFADIFRANAIKNGLLPVVLSPEAHRALAGVSLTPVTVDLRSRKVAWPGGTHEFAIDPFAALCLEQGMDQLEYILQFEEQIAAHESALRRGRA